MNQEKEIKKFSKAFNKEYGIFTYSGEMAIEVALKDINVENKCVILANNICYRVLLSVLRCKGIPIFIEPKNFTIEKDDLKGITKKYTNISAIIVAHQYGIKSNIKEIKKQINDDKIKIIEDIAQGWGIEDIGRYSDYVITSFGKSKPLSLGIGGAVFSNFENMKNILDFNSKKSRMNEEDILPYLLPNNIVINYTKMKKIGNRNIKKQIENTKLIKRIILNNYYNEINYLNTNDAVWNRLPIWTKDEHIYRNLLNKLKYYEIEYELPYKIKLNKLPILKKYKYYSEIDSEEIQPFIILIKVRDLKRRNILKWKIRK